MRDFVSMDQSYLMQTYGERDLCLVRGEGVWLEDAQGRRYLDFSSGIGVASLGYRDAAYVSAVCEQITKIVHTSNLYLNEPSLRCAQMLIEQGGFGHKVFFCNSGAEANEGLIKLARKYSSTKYSKERTTILTLKHSFHGRTMATLTATGQDRFHQHFDPFMPGFYYAEATREAVLNALDDTVCAILAEPIQGEGGIHILKREFLEFLQEICQKKDLLLLFDEVQTGIGRTGHFYAHQTYGIKPDAISVAKGLGGGLPIGAFIANEKCSGVLTAGDHGSTFGANPVCTAAACEVLSRIATPEFLGQVSERGAYIMKTISAWNLPVVKEVRGQGLMIGLQLNRSPKEVRAMCRDRGLLVLTAGEDVLRLLPPLVLKQEEADAALEILKEVLQ